MPYRERITFGADNHAENTNALCQQNVENFKGLRLRPREHLFLSSAQR